MQLSAVLWLGDGFEQVEICQGTKEEAAERVRAWCMKNDRTDFPYIATEKHDGREASVVYEGGEYVAVCHDITALPVSIDSCGVVTFADTNLA